MDTPRILTLTGTAYPQAFVQRIDPANGILGFAWLDAQGNRVDSGSSVARFAPVEPLPKEQPTDPDTYPDIEDATLAAAIENPPAVVPPVPQSVTRRQLLLTLHAAGITRAQIKQTIGGDPVGLIEYEEASSFDRSHPLIDALGAAMGMNSAQVDDLFRAAAAR